MRVHKISLVPSKVRKDNLIGLKFLLFTINLINTQLFMIVDLRLAAKLIKTVKFENTTRTYSLTGKLSYDLKLEDEKHILYKMLAFYNCNGCSSAPLMQYINNEIYQEMPDEDNFADNERDDRIYIDMRRTKGYTDELEKINRDDSGVALHIKLKEAAAKKLRIRITGFSQAEYWYV